jgi:hypothetical protein
MPNRLSNVKAGAQSSFADDAPSKNPEMAAKILMVLSAWAKLDAEMGLVFARFLHTEAHIGVAIYNTLGGLHAQDAAMKTAAAQVLTEEEMDLLMALLRLAKGPRNNRNEIAHGVWGYSNDVPDALLLLSPKDSNKLRGDMAAVWEQFKKDPQKVGPALLRRIREPVSKDIWVYRPADTDELQRKATEAYGLWDTFTHFFWPNSSAEGDVAHRQLLAHRAIRQVIDQRRADRGEPPLSPL